MADEPATEQVEPQTPEPEAADKEDVEKQAFLDRLSKESAKRKDAEKRATEIEKSLAELKAQMEERESAGLPELDRERKRAEQLEKRAAEADKRAEDAEAKVQRGQRERWVAAAAQSHDFADPSDAAAFVELDEIDDEKDAERAVKRLAARKSHLLKREDPQLPGQVLKNGRPTTSPTTKDGAIDLDAEAQMVSDGLKQFLKNRQTV